MRGGRKKLAALAHAIAAQPSKKTPSEADKSNPWIAAILAAQEQAAPDELYLWPDSVELWAHWLALQTQWRTSAAGTVTGLDYAGVRAYFECSTPLQGDALREAFDAIRAAERGHLQGCAERAEREKPPTPPGQ